MLFPFIYGTEASGGTLDHLFTTCNDYNISHLGLSGLDILVITLLYLQYVVALVYLGTDSQFIPENDELHSDDENVVWIEGGSKQAAKLAKVKAKEQRSVMKVVNAFCEGSGIFTNQPKDAQIGVHATNLAQYIIISLYFVEWWGHLCPVWTVVE